MRYLSVCSGIEAATQAWHPLGWQPVAFSEIEKFPSAVLAHHYPNVPNWGDMTKFKEWPDATVDVLVGGTPCQSFSVAGLRKGLADPRGNLALTYLAIADKYRPTWMAWENVPGVLSSNGGKDFGAFLGGLAELGYGFAYRILDAQFCRTRRFPRAVPQRRRRVFVVGYLGDWRRAAAVLFDAESLRGNPPPRREAGQTAPTIPARSTAGGGLGTDFDCDGGAIPIQNATRGEGQNGLGVGGNVMFTLDTASQHGVAHALRGEGFDASEDGTGRGTPIVPECANPLTARMHKGINTTPDEGQTPIPVAFPWQAGGTMAMPHDVDLCGTLVKNQTQAVAFVQNTRDEVRLMGDACIQNATRGKSQNGLGISSGETSYTLDTTSQHAVSVSLRGRDGGATAELGGPIAVTLRAATGGGDKPHVMTETCYNKGISHNEEQTNARPQKADAAKALRILRKEIGEEAFTEWGLGILDSLFQAEILRQALHGQSIRREAGKAESGLDDCALPRQEAGAARTLLEMREAGRQRRTPQGRGLAKQCARELGAHLSELPQQGAPSTSFLHSLREASEGVGVLQQALSSIQEMGRPPRNQVKSAHTRLAVRRLTPKEAERLQGFPDDFTKIPWRNKPADKCPDGPRYKALGNSMAVNVMEWLGQRIQMVSELEGEA